MKTETLIGINILICILGMFIGLFNQDAYVTLGWLNCFFAWTAAYQLSEDD